MVTGFVRGFLRTQEPLSGAAKESGNAGRKGGHMKDGYSDRENGLPDRREGSLECEGWMRPWKV